LIEETAGDHGELLRTFPFLLLKDAATLRGEFGTLISSC